MLLSLLLLVALIIIAAGIAAPSIAFEIRRDREEELIHRGFQYTRAIRLYASKNGRYPLKVEDLQGTNGIRYIRRLYKDPLTGGDFKLLHLSDMPSIGGTSNLNPNANSNFAGSTGLNPASAPPPQSQPFGQRSQPDQNSDQAQSDSNDPTNSSDVSGQTGSSNGNAGSAQTSSFGTPQPGRQQTLGSGGVIFGVASKSKDKTIREFNHKNHYSEWLFFYYPPYGARERNAPTSLVPTTGTGIAPNGAVQSPNQNGQQPPAQQSTGAAGQQQ